jgi:hypothetical protein
MVAIRDVVNHESKTLSKFKGGTIIGVVVTVEKTQYIDLEKLAAGAFTRD